MANQLPAFWPGWETVRILGRGSFGTVYEIQRDILGKMERAALKVISIPKNNEEIEELYNDGFSREGITRRFESYLHNIVREYTMMQEMKGHTNIVYCDDMRYIQRDDGIGWDIYIKMELLTAMTKSLPAQIPEDMVIRAGLDLCRALVLCKKKHIVHRDIKPQNVFISPDGDFKLGDFGIARTMEHTTSGTKTGTYKYMAPEVYNNKPYGNASDIYSLGLVLYWMLNERRTPFLPLPPKTPTVSQEEEARARRLNGAPLPPPRHGSKKLQKIVLKACAYNPSDRYTSAAQMYQELAALTDDAPKLPGDPIDDPIPGDDSGGEDTIIEEKKKRKPRSLAAGLAAIVALAAGFWMLHPHQWKDATCESPSKCSICGETRGDIASHSWTDAVCDAPQTCAICGVTQGQPLEHQWLDATCLAPAACSLCGETQGQMGDHLFQEATYIAPATCIHCGETQGRKLGAPMDGAHGFSIGLNSDGTVFYKGTTFWGRPNISEWKDIVSVAAHQGFVMGLKSDGTVMANGYGYYSPDTISRWTDIVQIALNLNCAVGLRSDGSCVYSGRTDHDITQLGKWRDIVAIASEGQHVVGLKSDGTAVAVGDNWGGRCDVSEWKNLVGIAAGAEHTVGLMADGTVEATGLNDYGQCNTLQWTDVVAVDAGSLFTVALHADGTVSAVGSNEYGQCEVSDWEDIICIATGHHFTMGLKADGTVVSTGNNHLGQCELGRLS